MTRVDIEPGEWLTHPMLVAETHRRLVAEGLLLASQDAKGRLNPMTIGWGVFGCIWGRSIFPVLVRPSRYTYECIEHTGDYTVNVLPVERADAVTHCGTASGRDEDKMAQCEFTLLPSREITSGGIAEANMVLECRVVHFNDVQSPTFPSEILSHYYPDGDFHRVYFGEVLGVSASETFLRTRE